MFIIFILIMNFIAEIYEANKTLQNFVIPECRAIIFDYYIKLNHVVEIRGQSFNDSDDNVCGRSNYMPTYFGGREDLSMLLTNHVDFFEYIRNAINNIEMSMPSNHYGWITLTIIDKSNNVIISQENIATGSPYYMQIYDPLKKLLNEIKPKNTGLKNKKRTYSYF
jgi:phage-related protein